MATLKICSLMQSLIDVSEKAAEIARRIRSEHALFQLLVEEKTGESKNKRFIEDFKTLADVLVQETVRHEVEGKFKGISANIKGEESNKFTNTLGETVEIEVKPTQEESAQLLGRVLNDNREAAELLAEIVHSNITMPMTSDLQEVQAEIPIEDVGIWIDPIDSTAQYIHGYESVECEGGLYREGLQCVVVLIGAYNRHTGTPILGVLNQPFSSHDANTNKWSGRCIWGIHHQDLSLNHVPALPHFDPATNQEALNWVVMSTSENKAVQDKISNGFHACYAAGAGYKILTVIDGLVGAYVLSQGSTFKWDTCSPHAVLLSMCGNLIDFKKALDVVRGNKDKAQEELESMVKSCAILYDKPDDEDKSGGDQWSNSGGIIAYRDIANVIHILNTL